MLLRFATQNHYSIRDYQEVSLIATKLRDREDGLIPTSVGAEVEPSKALRVVPVIAFYGGNASGKSSFIHAMQFYVRFIRNSHSQTSLQEKTPYFPFALDEESRSQPSKYDADFVLEGNRYHYGFELDGKQVRSEWLYSFPLTTTRQTRSVLFHRDCSQKNVFHFGKSLRGENKQIAKLVRPNSLYLSAAAQNAHPQLSSVHNFFTTQVNLGSRLNTTDLSGHLASYFADDAGNRNAALELLKSADIGICGMDFSKVQRDEKQLQFANQLRQLVESHIEGELKLEVSREASEVSFMHTGAHGKTFPIKIDAESAGTRTLLGLVGPVFEKLKDGGLMVIDEISSTLHPLISRHLIGLFQSLETNPGRAQLVFSTHDTNLLVGQLLRRDQIVFTEKARDGATHIYAMSDIKVRASDNLEASYLSGRFGAIPLIEQLIIRDDVAGNES